MVSYFVMGWNWISVLEEYLHISHRVTAKHIMFFKQALLFCGLVEKEVIIPVWCNACIFTHTHNSDLRTCSRFLQGRYNSLLFSVFTGILSDFRRGYSFLLDLKLNEYNLTKGNFKKSLTLLLLPTSWYLAFNFRRQLGMRNFFTALFSYVWIKQDLVFLG